MSNLIWLSPFITEIRLPSMIKAEMTKTGVKELH